MLALAGSLAAQTAPTAPAVTTPATPPADVAAQPAAATTGKVATPKSPAAPSMELPRLKTTGKSDAPRLAPTKVTVADLSPQGTAGARTVTKQNLNYLALDAGKTWSRPLRGSPTGTTFVSFLAYASVGTVLDIGGAQLTVKPSTKAGYAQVGWTGPAAGSSTPPLLGLMRLEKHNGADLVALPVLTLRLDPAAGVWDLYSFHRLVADDVPLPAAKDARQFSLTPGAQGAWVLNLVTSDENPLFLDANNNGIDDAFEKAQPGNKLLAANANAAQRTQLVQTWKTAQKTANVPAWKIRRPVPDTFIAAAPTK
jgi:hypothetical protein